MSISTEMQHRQTSLVFAPDTSESLVHLLCIMSTKREYAPSHRAGYAKFMKPSLMLLLLLAFQHSRNVVQGFFRDTRFREIPSVLEFRYGATSRFCHADVGTDVRRLEAV